MTVLELFAIIRKHLKFIIVLPVLCAIVTAFICWTMLSNEYTATVSIYALMNSGDDNVNVQSSQQYNSLNSGQLLANDFAKIVQNEQIQAKTADKLGLNDLKDFKIKVTKDEKSRVVSIDVTGKNPANSAEVANQLASDLGESAVSIMGVQSVNIISSAETPTSPSGPKRMQITLIALLAALFLAIAIAVIIEFFNTKIRSEKDITEKLGVPVIGRFPQENL